MPDYNTLRTINGAESLIAALIVLCLGITLLHRGYAEREHWARMVPGRIVIGSFLSLKAIIDIEAAIAKIWFRHVAPGGVGRLINHWSVNTALLVSILLGVWSLWRLWRNTLGSRNLDHTAERIADSNERLATATEALVEQGAHGKE